MRMSRPNVLASLARIPNLYKRFEEHRSVQLRTGGRILNSAALAAYYLLQASFSRSMQVLISCVATSKYVLSRWHQRNISLSSFLETYDGLQSREVLCLVHQLRQYLRSRAQCLLEMDTCILHLNGLPPSKCGSSIAILH
jgi:hypothetical protein